MENLPIQTDVQWRSAMLLRLEGVLSALNHLNVVALGIFLLYLVSTYSRLSALGLTIALIAYHIIGNWLARRITQPAFAQVISELNHFSN